MVHKVGASTSLSPSQILNYHISQSYLLTLYQTLKHSKYTKHIKMYPKYVMC